MLRFVLLSDANKDGYQPLQVQDYCAIAVGLCLGANIVAFFAAHYVQAHRSLSLRRGAQRRKWVSLFSALCITCYFTVFVLSYTHDSSRSKVLSTETPNLQCSQGAKA